MGTKKGRIYGKRAPFKGASQVFFGGAVAQNSPPLDPPLRKHQLCFITAVSWNAQNAESHWSRMNISVSMHFVSVDYSAI